MRAFTPQHFYYVYVLSSVKRDGEIYVGCTRDLRKRVKEHNEGRVVSTKRYLPWNLVYYEAFSAEPLAWDREKRLKRNSNSLLELKKRLGKAPRTKSARGFTLIETIIYIALFSFIMSGVLLSVYGMTQSGDQFATKNLTANEGGFVTAKINWALSSLGSISTPASGYGNSLTIVRNDGTQVDIRLTGGVVEMRVGGGGSYIPLSTSNVQVTSLGFSKLSGTPSGIEASTTINGITYMTRRYLRN